MFSTGEPVMPHWPSIHKISSKRCNQDMRKQTSLILAIGLAFSVTASIVACRKTDSKSEARAEAVPSAKVATAQRGDISHVLTLAGQFQPYQVVDVHPKVSGYMSCIRARRWRFLKCRS